MMGDFFCVEGIARYLIGMIGLRASDEYYNTHGHYICHLFCLNIPPCVRAPRIRELQGLNLAG